MLVETDLRTSELPRRGWRAIMSVEGLVFACAAVTALVLTNAHALTGISLTLKPQHEGSAYFSYVYGDETNGGASVAMAEQGDPLRWQCRLSEKYKYGYCGFGLLLDKENSGRGLNLGRFDEAQIRLRYEGPGRSLRLSIKNRNPRYISYGAPSAEKVSQAGTPVTQGEQTIALNLNYFAVAEWWRDSAPRPAAELAHPDFDNVTAIEFLTGVESSPGKHRLVVREITLKGSVVSADVLYAALAAGWALLIAGILLYRRNERTAWERQQARTLQKTIDTIPQMVWSIDEHGLVHVNDRWEDFTGLRVRRDPSIEWWEAVHPDELKAVTEAWEETVKDGRSFEFEFRLRHNSGQYRWVLARANAAVDERGMITGWYGTCTDVHDRVQAQSALMNSVAAERRKSEELRWTGEHDALTGLPNRKSFKEHLGGRTAHALESGTNVGLLLLDLDHFKHINDTLGHSTGDQLLTAFAETLRASVREVDFVARLGGDEFAIVIEPVEDEEDLSRTARSLLLRIQAPIKLNNRTVGASASIGGALFPRDGSTAQELFNNADTALYALKAAGRGGMKMFHSDMRRQAQLVASQLNLARLGLSDATVVPHYQPKVELATGRVVGLEALLRWKHPSRGLQDPLSVAEAFKDYELATKIGSLMQSKVLSDLRDWQEAGIEVGRVAINAAPVEFLRDDFAERLLERIAFAGVSPRSVELEVTEQVFYERGLPLVDRALQKLAAAGVSIALDDFGTGYSSLAHLRDFPVRVVKIDSSFVRDLPRDPQVGSIVCAIAGLAQSLGIEVVAEGIETAEEKDAALLTGCAIGQGHHFGRASQSDEVPMMFSSMAAAHAA